MLRRTGQLVAATAITLLVLWALEYSGATRPLWDRLSPVRRISPPPSQKEVLFTEITADITQVESQLRDLEKQRQAAKEAKTEIVEALKTYCETNAIDGSRLVEQLAKDDPEVRVMVRGLQKKGKEIEQFDRQIGDHKDAISLHRARRLALEHGVPLRAKEETPSEALRREMSGDACEPQHNTIQECLRRHAAER